MNPIMHTIVRGIVPVGSIVGGILGGPTGVVNTLHAEGIGQWFASLLDTARTSSRHRDPA